MIYYGCPKCGTPMASPDSMRGQAETCAECGNVTTVPNSAMAPVVAEPLVRQATQSEFMPYSPQQKQPPNLRVIVQQNVFGQPRGKGANGLGIAGLILGIIACLTAWIPVIGIISIPFAVLGLLFGGLGFIFSLIGRRSRIGMPFAAIIVCLVALGFQILYAAAYVEGNRLSGRAATQPATTTPAEP